MTARLIALELTLVAFAAASGLVLFQHGVQGLAELLTANSATLLVMVDLTIALLLVLIWMYRDARERGLGFWPYAALTCAFGSVGPLLYLVRRELRAQPRAVAQEA